MHNRGGRHVISSKIHKTFHLRRYRQRHKTALVNPDAEGSNPLSSCADSCRMQVKETKSKVKTSRSKTRRHDRSKRKHRHRRHRKRRPVEYISPWIKCLLFSFNFFFWLIGSGIAAIGFWILTEKDKKVRDFLDIVFDPSILMCTAGCIIFTLGFFGCLGALRENICLIKTFHIMLTIILILELLAAVWVFVFYYVPDARELIGDSKLENSLKQAIVRYRDDDDLRDMIDTVQREFQCCGVSNSDYGYRDWQENIYFNCSHGNPSVERCGVPHSCCKPRMGEILNVMCGFDTTNREVLEISGKIYVEGCVKGFGNWLERNTIIIGGVCLSVVLPQLLGICLARSFIDQIQMQVAQWPYVEKRSHRKSKTKTKKT